MVYLVKRLNNSYLILNFDCLICLIYNSKEIIISLNYNK